jgi:Tfp pilus assembly protein PilO
MPMNEKDKITLFLGIIIPVMIVGIFYYFDMQIFKPKREQLKADTEQLQDEINALNQEMRDMKAALARKDEILKIYEAVVERAGALQTQLDWEGNLKQINRMVTQTGISTKTVSPKAHTSHSLYTDFPYGIAGQSRYHEFGLLLNLIELNPERMMRVKQFDVSNNKDTPIIHPFSLTLATYVFNREIPELK